MPVVSPRLLPLAATLVLAAAPVRAVDFQRIAEVGIGPGTPNAVAFSPDGKLVAMGGGYIEGALEVWDIAANKFAVVLKGHEAPVWTVAFSTDGKFLASGGEDKTARVWDLGSGKEIAKIDTFGKQVTGVAFSPDGKTLAATSNDNSAVLFDLESKKVKFTLSKHEGPVRGVAFSPDGKVVATVGKDKQVFLWNAETGKPRMSIKSPDVLYACVFTPDGKQLLVAGGDEGKGGDHSIKSIDMADKKATTLFKGHESSIWSLSVTADSKTLVSGGYTDKTARLWDLEGKAAKGVQDTMDEVRAVALSPDGKTLAVAASASIKLWKVKGN
jgi:WD40 repeat protein